MPGVSKYPMDLKQDIAAARERGLTYEQLSRKFSVPLGTVETICLDQGADSPKWRSPIFKRRATYIRNGQQVRPMTSDEDTILLELHRRGWRKSDIAERLKRPRSTIKNRFKYLARRERRQEEWRQNAPRSQ